MGVDTFVILSYLLTKIRCVEGLETVSSNFLSISESVMVSSISAAQERLMKMAPLASRWGGLFGSSLNGNIAAEELEK